MNCPICKIGEMKKIKDTIREDNVEFEAFKCGSCGEEIMDMKQLKVLALEARERFK